MMHMTMNKRRHYSWQKNTWKAKNKQDKENQVDSTNEGVAELHLAN